MLYRRLPLLQARLLEHGPGVVPDIFNRGSQACDGTLRVRHDVGPLAAVWLHLGAVCVRP